MSLEPVPVTGFLTFPHLGRRVGQREPALGQQPHIPGGLGNEWSGASKAGRLLMVTSGEGEAEVAACKLGHVGAETHRRGAEM